MPMILCDALDLTTWSPDFSSSGQSNPDWTRVTCGGLEIANSVGYVDWPNNPVQVILCESCGHPGCNSGGYVHLSRLHDHVLWTAPQPDEPDDWEATQYRPSFALRKCGALAVSKPAWQRLRAINPSVPTPEDLPSATRRTLADAWRLSATGRAQVDDLGAVLPMLREQLLATETFDPREAIEMAETLLAWLAEAPGEPLTGTIREARAVEAQVETLYFDGPHDWPAFALRGSVPLLALSRDLVYVPEEVA